MALTDRFKVSITVHVENEDGTPYFANTTEYASMPYAGVVVIERELVTVLSNLVAMGEQDVQAATS
jgi:hypothetical protein